LSSTNGAHLTSRLRRASASHRLHAFLEQISALETSNFPHPDGLAALRQLRKETERQLRRLTLCPITNEALIDRLYAQARNTVSRYTPILGFILRSTNVRNAFEVHFPLKRLAKKLIGSKAKLIVSSEWGFVPFTYPMTLDQLPQFALVGGPASESGNVLTIPVAGHEIGHSVWRAHSRGFGLDPKFLAAIDGAIAGHPAETSRLMAQLGGGARATDQIRRLVYINGIKQLEEIFCDAIGLYFFGPSFLYAMEYFLAPGGGARSLTYPSDLDRLKILTVSSSTLGIAPTLPLFERWADSSLQASQTRDFVTILDSAVAALVADVTSAAFNMMKKRRVLVPNPAQIQSAIDAFDRGEPHIGDATLPEIVTAGWEIVRREGGLAEKRHWKRYRLLGDLMLKSIEVAEFRLRMDNA
jgi:hypothetical protein